MGIEILHKIPETVDLDWIVDAYHKSERILFLDESGKEIGRVGQYYDPPKANFRWWKPRTWSFGWITFNEDINQALIRLGDEDINQALIRLGDEVPIQFILSSFQGAVIIYKAPKGYSVQGWMKHQQELERAAIQNECAQIDAT